MFASLGNALKRLMFRFKEGLWKLVNVLAILEFSSSDLTSFFEVAILVQQFVDFVLDFGL